MEGINYSNKFYLNVKIDLLLLYYLNFHHLIELEHMNCKATLVHEKV